MPIRPRPFRQYCPSCSWRGPVIALRSDAPQPSDLAALRKTCPKCGQTELESQLVPAQQSVLSKLMGVLTGERF